MPLYLKLQQAQSEEDVKDAYIKALGLKDYYKNLYDIQTKEIWFEAKDGLQAQYQVKYRDENNKKRKTVIYITFYDYEKPKAVKGFTLIE